MIEQLKKISIVTPIYNEKDNVKLLLEKLYSVLDTIDYTFEVIAVDDGSSDGSAELLDHLITQYHNLRVIHFKRNFGQTAAMMAGFDEATGDVMIPMDSDLQNDPDDIPKLLQKIEEGYDVVSGWRKNRQDHAIKRNFLSRVANKIISYISGVKLHDYGCTLKAYKKSCMEGVRLYGEMHRFIPIYAHLMGAKVTEIPVNHHPRVHGESKYGMNRIFKVILDLMVLKFMDKYLKKPIYLFGGTGLLLLFISGLSFLFSVYLKLIEKVPFIDTPLILFSSMTFITGIMCILMGILAEMIIRIYFESQDKKSYNIKTILEGIKK